MIIIRLNIIMTIITSLATESLQGFLPCLLIGAWLLQGPVASVLGALQWLWTPTCLLSVKIIVVSQHTHTHISPGW